MVWCERASNGPSGLGGQLAERAGLVVQRELAHQPVDDRALPQRRLAGRRQRRLQPHPWTLQTDLPAAEGVGVDPVGENPRPLGDGRLAGGAHRHVGLELLDGGALLRRPGNRPAGRRHRFVRTRRRRRSAAAAPCSVRDPFVSQVSSGGCCSASFSIRCRVTSSIYPRLRRSRSGTRSHPTGYPCQTPGACSRAQ